MRISFNFLLCLAVCLGLSSACVDEVIQEFPPIEPQGNVFALFEPGKKLSLQAAITGYRLDRVDNRDSLRLQANLYENGELAETFNLTSQSKVEWGASYRLECLIDNKYNVVGQIILPQDSLLIDTGVITPLPEIIETLDGNGRKIRLKYKRSFKVNTPSGPIQSQVFLSRGSPGSLPYFNTIIFPNGTRAEALPSDQENIFEVLLPDLESAVNLMQINRSYYQFIKELRDPKANSEIVPGNLSVNNMSQGTGIMAYQIVYKRL